jgi:hypothetical protein
MSNIALLDNVKQGIAVQSTVGSPSVVPANYVGFLSNPLPPQVPGNESVNTSSMVGNGSSRVAGDIYNYYWRTGSLPISGLLNDHITTILMKGFLAGATTTTTTSVTVKDYATVQKTTSVVPSMFSIYRHNQGEQFILGDLFPNAFSISQEGEAQPTFSIDMMGTGKFLDATAIAAAPFDESLIVAAPTYKYFHGAATVVTFTDGTTTYDLTNQGRLISLSVEGNNGGRVARRPGDTFYNTADRNSGAFAKNIAMGKASGHRIVFKIDLGTALTEWAAMVQRKTITGGSIKFVGFDLITGVYAYEYEILFPKARFSVISGDTDDAYGALTVEIVPEPDPTTGGFFTVRARTDKTTTII